MSKGKIANIQRSLWPKTARSQWEVFAGMRAAAIIVAVLFAAFSVGAASITLYTADTGLISASGRGALAPSAADTQQPVGKNETVYGILNNDGSVDTVEIVNHVYLRSNTAGSVSWQDYGSYTNLINLLDDREPQQTPLSSEEVKKAANASGHVLSDYDDMRSIIWNNLETADWQDLYYQGTSERALPWIIDFTWKLDGSEVSASALAGASGRVELSIEIEPSDSSDDIYKESYMLQVSVPLALNKTREVETSQASSMIAGRTKTLAYTVLPGQSGSFNISFQADNFSMEPIQITALPANIDLQGFESLTGGVREIRQGQTSLADGTDTLGSGMSELLTGLEQLSFGLASFSAGGSELQGAMSAYSGGITELKTQMGTLAEGGAAFAGGLDQYALSGQQVLQGYAQLTQQLALIRLPVETQAELEQLLALPDQLPDGTDLTAQKEMAQSLLTLDGGIGSMEQSLQQLNNSLGDYVDGAGTLSGQYGQIYSGMAALEPAAGKLADAFGQINDGYRQREQGLPEITEGLEQLSLDGVQLPDAAAELSLGQRELAAGLEELEQAVSDLMEYKEPELMSFAAPGLILPDSVQFLIRTHGIS